MLMTDGPTHFKNKTVRLASKGLHVPYHFTLPFSQLTSGGVEKLDKEPLRVFRAVILELGPEHGEWLELLPLVQSAINHRPLRSVAGHFQLRL